MLDAKSSSNLEKVKVWSEKEAKKEDLLAIKSAVYHHTFASDNNKIHDDMYKRFYFAYKAHILGDTEISDDLLISIALIESPELVEQEEINYEPLNIKEPFYMIVGQKLCKTDKSFAESVSCENGKFTGKSYMHGKSKKPSYLID